MAELKIPLPTGSKFGERIATHAVLRELGTRDIVEAGEASEKCVLGPDREYHLVRSPALSGLHLLCRQIARLEDAEGTVLDGPLDPALFFKLEPADFLAISNAADDLDNAAQAALEKMTDRGRGEPAS